MISYQLNQDSDSSYALSPDNSLLIAMEELKVNSLSISSIQTPR